MLTIDWLTSTLLESATVHCVLTTVQNEYKLLCLAAGPDAPLVLERGLTSCHMQHVYDFYKPAGLYPKVCHPEQTAVSRCKSFQCVFPRIADLIP